MPFRLTKIHGILFTCIFVCALLFFGITKQVAQDVTAAKTEARQQQLAAAAAKQQADTARVATTIPVPKPTPVLVPPKPVGQFTYLEVTDSCGAHYGGECLRVRGGPGTEYPVVGSLRNGMVLKVASTTVGADGRMWHKVVFDEWLRYPERHNGDWFVAAEYVTTLSDPGPMTLATHPPQSTTTKRILVDRSEQKLYAYDGDALFMVATSSTGLDSTPTPRGVFTIYQKTPSRYMQGPLPNINSDDYYDLPGVPWNLYFTEAGAVIHGAYWHDKFGTKYSHGCVNLAPAVARIIYNWAELGITVTVQD